MKKIWHKSLHDEYVPKNLTEPIYVVSTELSLSEVEEIMRNTVRRLKPFLGQYQLVLEFTEPNTDPRFVLGHVGAVISVFAETEDLVEPMRKALGIGG